MHVSSKAHNFPCLCFQMHVLCVGSNLFLLCFYRCLCSLGKVAAKGLTSFEFLVHKFFKLLDSWRSSQYGASEKPVRVLKVSILHTESMARVETHFAWWFYALEDIWVCFSSVASPFGQCDTLHLLVFDRGCIR